jgi:hypothetical protein
MMTWSQLGIHRKAVGILNVCGFYDHLLAHLQHTINVGASSSSPLHIPLLLLPTTHPPPPPPHHTSPSFSSPPHIPKDALAHNGMPPGACCL